MVVGGQRHAPAALPRERPGTHCTGAWVGLTAGLDRCGKYRRPPAGFDPRTVRPVASRHTDCPTAAPIFGHVYYIANQFCKRCAKISNTLAWAVICMFKRCFLIIFGSA